MIKVSVLIPVYNTSKYLESCFKMILNQSLKEIEIICVNDGSSDNSLEILRKYEEMDARVRVIDQSNQGVSAARNTAVNRATGEYFYFFDGDDLIDEKALETLYGVCKNEDLDILFIDADYIRKKAPGQKEKKSTHFQRFNEYEVQSGTALFVELMKGYEQRPTVWLQLIKSAHYHENQLSFFEGIIYEDVLFTYFNTIKAKRARCLSRAESKRICGKEVLFKRRIRSGSIMTSKIKELNLRSYIRCFEEIAVFAATNKQSPPLRAATRIFLMDLIKDIIRTFDLLSKQNTDATQSATNEKAQLLTTNIYRKLHRLKRGVFSQILYLKGLRDEYEDDRA